MLTKSFDFKNTRRVHIIGVGGAGMSAIAEVLTTMGYSVTGSDLKESSSIHKLRTVGVRVAVGHSPDNVIEADLVAHSSAISEENVEYLKSVELGLPILTRAKILAEICKFRKTIAVAGTHGKTTTSSMLALVLREAGAKPSFIIGGDVNEIGTGAAWDNGELFVVEADESDGSFLDLPCDHALITNIEPDHLDFYGDFNGLLSSFESFADGVSGYLIINIDGDYERQLAESQKNAISLGLADDADWRIQKVTEAWEGSSFELLSPKGEQYFISIPIPGIHNVYNAAFAAVVGLLLGFEALAVIRALSRFAGVARRFEHRGNVAGVGFVDDYAHLPSEVAVTIRAARTGDWQRIVAVFQPHRYSRTELLADSFAEAFSGADVVYVTDVYPAGELPKAGVSGQLIVDAIAGMKLPVDVRYEPRRSELLSGLVSELREGDLCLTMGAGDLTSLADEVQMRLEV